MLRKPTIQVVIVNWNAGTLLADCLQSFEAVAEDKATLSRVTVVDNNSTDNSLAGLPELAGNLPLQIIRNDGNIGFGAACNQGARGSTADFLLFLNPDTRLTAGSLEAPAQFLMDPHNGAVGIVGIQLIDPQGKVARNCARRPTARSMIGQSLGLDRCGFFIFPQHFMVEWDHGDTRAVGQVMGAFFFLRRTLFEKLGGFDERFFVYYEDLDFAMRARELGATSVYLATARAFHRGLGTTERVKDIAQFYNWRSRVLFAFKHFGVAGGTAVLIATAAIEPPLRVLVLLALGRPREIGDVLRATWLLWRNLINMARGNTRSAAG
jgi:N-acetylglucosaminyl-diphospho-decaprenol L-rhamnosyltransferase